MRRLLKTLPSLSSLLLLRSHGSLAQNCYYPNGDLAHGDAPCSSNGGACCPLNWACESNGLCYLGNADYYGRYTCTDQTWQASSCPGFCTQNNTAGGNEALLQCSDGSWCCDGNRSFNCCDVANGDNASFSLPRGSQVAFISSIPSASSVTSSKSSNSAASSSTTMSTSKSFPSTARTTSSLTGYAARPSSTTASTTASSPASVQISASSTLMSSTQSSATSSSALVISSQSVATNTDGVATTIVLISTVSAPALPSTASPSAEASDPSHSRLDMIVGIAVGVPVVLIIASMLGCLLWRRQRKAKRPTQHSHESSDGDKAEKFGHQVGYVPPDGRAPELDSYPVATNRASGGQKSELDGSSNHSPTISMMTNRSSGFAGPPGYSPVTPQLGSVVEQQEPAELWGGYVPYRPAVGGTGGMKDEGK
ncbi:hypothetical protein BAUCODRAFT_246983 [Baudoinia panamericana UAMH 10762]|uniref:Mid2 domain-containing protein n=1 Tax=Baudoinia panamericana (strain UAMH 10762) TaxID=717646 RepID=M2MQ74_BAUPA|nr:uncharacterized protein BAUCODRAFT_246983 [Baudoinia panamericana UAMH 10762]EMC93618.1 hypothetical protein BAUCODRAFT_246983 [Baudoinia panamericana UAMH 10762]